MGLSADPEKRAKQLANLAQSNAKLAERLAAGNPPEAPKPKPKAKRRPPVTSSAPPPPARRTPPKNAPRRAEPAPERRSRVREFFSGLVDL
jgi:hypothetical protein